MKTAKVCSGFMLCVFLLSAIQQSFASDLNQQLSDVQKKIRNLRDSMIETTRNTKNTNQQILRIKQLKELQRAERALTEKKIIEFEKEIDALHVRRSEVEIRRDSARLKLQNELADLMSTVIEVNSNLMLIPEADSTTQTKRMVLSQWIQLRLKDLELIRSDYEDSVALELRILEEKTRLEELKSGLQEQEALLAFHQKAREEINENRSSERSKQLAEVERLRKSQEEIEELIVEFRKRQTKSNQNENAVLMRLSPSVKWVWPILGKVISRFGSSTDSESGLHVFKKGIEIASTNSDEVKAALDGSVQFVGRLPGRGNVIILAHTGEFFSVYGQLADFKKQVGDSVRAGDEIGKIVPNEGALYFEIRSRNLALDPLKWLKEH